MGYLVEPLSGVVSHRLLRPKFGGDCGIHTGMGCDVAPNGFVLYLILFLYLIV